MHLKRELEYIKIGCYKLSIDCTFFFVKIPIYFSKNTKMKFVATYVEVH